MAGRIRNFQITFPVLRIVFLTWIISGVITCGHGHKAGQSVVSLRNVYSDNQSLQKELRKNEAEQVLTAVNVLIHGVVDQKSDEILSLVHPDGAYIDLKAKSSREYIEKVLQNKEDPLYKAMWSTKGFRELSGEDDILCYRDSFLEAGKLDLDLFFYTDREVEARLVYSGRPSSGLMGNPIFHKIDGRWYLMQFF